MDHQTFEEICRKSNMRPVHKEVRSDCTIYIADGFRTDKPDEYPAGYFRTVWCTARGEMDIARPLEFDAMHDVESLPLRDRERARINAAIKDAIVFVNDNKETGRYE